MMSSGRRVCCAQHPDAALIKDYHAGDQICSECGLVIGNRVVDVGPEWLSNSDQNPNCDPSLVGACENPLLSGSDLSTTTGRSSDDADLRQTAKHHKRKKMSSSDQTLVKAFRDMSHMANRMNLPKIIVDEAHSLFKQVHDGKTLRGRSIDAMASACLHVACRQEGATRTFKEICSISKVSVKQMSRCFNLILKASETSVNLITTEDLMSRFSCSLDLSPCVQQAATHIARKAVELDIVPGRSPISVAAAAIFMASEASQNKKSLKEIVDMAGAAAVTIKQMYKLMLPKAKDLFPADFKFHTSVHAF